MNFIYPHSSPEILKLGIRWALYREKKPEQNYPKDSNYYQSEKIEYNKKYRQWQQSRIAYLKEPEFKVGQVIYCWIDGCLVTATIKNIHKN